ncbi:hypothetical protein F443_16471 [Phytophthora nicotianae P1569]|uniref:Uncharacterized protein n=2 Tax=Phytophthora nicotianae TaxID=4792 RepID=V9EE93_PHYNI|nr:hypothetical protein F443_16471 [Phytophthora nicotianae P1569]
MAVKRRSERDAATEESKQDSSSAPSTESAIVSGSTRDSSSGNYSGTSNRKNSKTAKAAQDGSLAAYLEQQVMSHHEDNALLEQQLKLMKQKGEDEALRWDREFAFKSKKLELAERKWNDEVELRRQEMQIRREEIVLLRLQLQASQNQVGNRGADERFPASN